LIDLCNSRKVVSSKFVGTNHKRFKTVVLIWVSTKDKIPIIQVQKTSRLYGTYEYQADRFSEHDIAVSHCYILKDITKKKPQTSHRNKHIWRSVVHPADMKYRHHYTRQWS
jgi:hypothetical protein